MKVDPKLLGIAVLLMVIGGIASVYAKDAAIRGAGATLAIALASMMAPWLKRNVFPSAAPPAVTPPVTTTLPAPPPLPVISYDDEEKKS